MRRVLILLLGLLPASRVKNRLLTLAGRGWQVHPTAIVQPCLLYAVDRADLGPQAAVGFGSAIRQVRELILEEDASLGQLNWVTAAVSYLSDRPEAGRLLLRASSAIGSRHYLDCSGGIELGAFAIVSGVRTTVLTHGLNLRTNVVEADPVRIGAYTLIGSAVVILKGSTIADRCAVGAGALVSTDLGESEVLYAGNPATERARLTGGLVFSRSTKLSGREP